MLLIHRYSTPFLTGPSLPFTALHFTSPPINTLHGARPEENNGKRQGNREYRPRFVPGSSQQTKKGLRHLAEWNVLWRNETLRPDSLVSNAERTVMDRQMRQIRDGGDGWWWQASPFRSSKSRKLREMPGSDSDSTATRHHVTGTNHMLHGWPIQEKWDGRDMWHVWVWTHVHKVLVRKPEAKRPLWITKGYPKAFQNRPTCGWTI
jgi:hypothetical protein